MFFIEGDTPDQVTGTSDNTGNCSVFQTKNAMKNAMITRVEAMKIMKELQQWQERTGQN